MRLTEPGNAVTLFAEKHRERLVNAKHSGDAGQHIDIERNGPMLSRLLAPAMEGRARRIAKHQPPLFLIQSPEISDREKGAQGRGAETAPVRRLETGKVQNRLGCAYVMRQWA